MVDGQLTQSTKIDTEEIKEDAARIQRLSTMLEMNKGPNYKNQATMPKFHPRTKTNDLFGKQVTMTNSSNELLEDIGNNKTGSLISDLEKPTLDHAQRLIMSATIRRNSLTGD